MNKLKLKDIGTIITGNTPSKKNEEFYNEKDINFYTPTDFEDGIVNYLDNSINYISEKAREKARILPKNSVLITCIGIIGKVGIAISECACNQQINAIIPNEDIVNNKYLSYWFIAKSEILRKLANAPVVPIINKTSFENLDINIPSIEEQETIVNKLDEIQEIIDINNKQINILNEIVKSTFIEMFGNPVINEKKWKIKFLNELGTLKNGMNFNKNDKGYKIKFLSVSDFKNGSYINDIDVLQELNLSEKPSEEYLLKDYDIVFVRSNGSKELVGRSILLRNINKEVTYSGFCIRYRNQNKDINTTFLINLFKNEEFKIQLKEDSRGANINNINQQMLSQLKIIIPPIELQNQFDKIVKEIEKQKEIYEINIQILKELKEKLMNKYFN